MHADEEMLKYFANLMVERVVLVELKSVRTFDVHLRSSVANFSSMRFI
jgi:hypothetical protein